MTITREQLEKAAKAVGIEATGYDELMGILFLNGTEEGPFYDCWNPRYDRSQLLDLAMARKIRIDPVQNEIAFIKDASLRWHYVPVNCQDFPALAEAVILAACEQFDARASV